MYHIKPWEELTIQDDYMFKLVQLDRVVVLKQLIVELAFDLEFVFECRLVVLEYALVVGRLA